MGFGRRNKCDKKCNNAWKRLWGYSMFCIALGMCVMWKISNECIAFFIILALLIVGYCLFCS